ncbi:Glutamyl aminopeptidase, partial [Pseudolycoriella hygida]
MKAKFNISLVIPSDGVYHALSNMPEESTLVNGDGTTTVRFQQSVRMSSYLACFIVSDFTHKKGQVTNGPEMRVYATPAQIDKVDFALLTGLNVTEYYINYFNVSYPLPKLDMAAIPDFVRSHGTLGAITMAWWDDLWLNEGFASYIEYKGTDFAYKDWKMMDQFLIDDLHSMLCLHGLSKWDFQLLIDLAWDRDNVRDQDYFTCMQNIAANPAGESLVWNYVRDNWSNMVARFGLNERYLGRMIPSICGRFKSQTRLDEVKAFFAKYPDAGAGAAAREQAIQDITNRIKWLENNQQKVSDWLTKNNNQN